VAGLLLASSASHLLVGLLYGVAPTDPRAYMVSCLALAIVALAACFAPAHRAGAIDPAVTIRAE
jgi:ABC-type lipoprotein release transport system permease subunit